MPTLCNCESYPQLFNCFPIMINIVLFCSSMINSHYTLPSFIPTWAHPYALPAARNQKTTGTSWNVTMLKSATNLNNSGDNLPQLHPSTPCIPASCLTTFWLSLLAIQNDTPNPELAAELLPVLRVTVMAQTCLSWDQLYYGRLLTKMGTSHQQPPPTTCYHWTTNHDIHSSDCVDLHT